MPLFLPSAPGPAISVPAVLSIRTSDMLLCICLTACVCDVGHVWWRSGKLLVSELGFVFLSVSLSLF